MRQQNTTNPLYWIANIGDSVASESNDGHVRITIFEDLLICRDGDPIVANVESIFPEYVESIGDMSCLCDRTALTPTLAVVEAVNDYMTTLNVGEVSRTYFSSDSVSN
ncbi:unnamed protein product [Cuscuta epithymum]|uniref:ATP-dependent DNA helicase n=1 Tax=Cuscuta epithymum TaxID=186058 RepID=A0AAV0E7P9_9ASTE|nr:unnamed protein product [Cuscuta epithymum]CAH9125604.1 unnamed protein product [Cuscuta epithymum]